MLLQERQPELHCLRMAITNLNQAPEGDALEVFLRLLVDEDGAGHCPALDLARQRNGTESWQTEVVCGTKGEVAEELEITRRIRAQLQVAHGHSVLNLAP